MLEVKNVIFGLLIWFFETFAILTILFKIAEKYWKSEIGKLVTYAVIILLSNLLPFIYTGNYLFGFSTLFSFVSILFYFFRLVDSSLSSFDTINFSIFDSSICFFSNASGCIG